MFGLGAGWLSTLKMSSEHLDCSQSFLSRILIDDRVEDTVCQSARNFDPLSAPNNDPAWSARVAGPMRCSLHTAQPDRASGVSVIPAS